MFKWRIRNKCPAEIHISDKMCEWPEIGSVNSLFRTPHGEGRGVFRFCWSCFRIVGMFFIRNQSLAVHDLNWKLSQECVLQFMLKGKNLCNKFFLILLILCIAGIFFIRNQSRQSNPCCTRKHSLHIACKSTWSARGGLLTWSSPFLILSPVSSSYSSSPFPPSLHHHKAYPHYLHLTIFHGLFNSRQKCKCSSILYAHRYIWTT